MKKPPYEQLSREKLQKKIELFRKIMAITAKSKTRMTNAIGADTWFETDKGRVRALTYGFEDPAVKPLVFNLHGSGFVMGTAAMDDPFMPQFVEKCGVKLISIDYPLSPEVMFPTAVEQCYALMRYCRAHADELHIDPDRIVIMGHSAGGNFCAAIGLMEQTSQALGLRGVILDYPPTDVCTDPFDKPLPKGCLPPKLCRLFDMAYRNPEDAKNPLISPAFATVDMVKDFPPTLVITAGQDSLSYETERLKDTLIEAGVDVTFRRFEGSCHAFTHILPRQAKRKPADYATALGAWQMMIDFINQYI